MTTIYVPRDSAAQSVGADAVAAHLAELLPSARIVRTGSRGMLWREPLVEVDSPRGRVGFGPVTVDAVPSLAQAIADDLTHPLGIGLVEEDPWLAEQTRWTFARVGVDDPLDPDAFEAAGGLQGLRAALGQSPDEVVAAVTESGLRGRGGAGFPAGIKWQTVAATPADQRYVCVNADEGDSGTYADRILLEGDPLTLLEGMAIAGHATGATVGIVYVRSEYPAAIATLDAAIRIARDRGWLGPDILGTGTTFDVSVVVGAGSYVCGEETAMLESIEGHRGQVRAKPPLPAVEGLYGRPTVINNVLTIAAVPGIVARGPAEYAALGTGRSRGTQAFQLAGNVARGGLVEVPFGMTLRELVEGYGAGTRSGRPVGAVQVGGPLGSYLRPDELDVPTDYEEMAAIGAMLGHGGIVVFDDAVDMAEQARFAMEFCAEESCGKCTPCRIGSVRGVEVIDRIRLGEAVEEQVAVLTDLCEVMRDGSLCAMGGLTPQPVLSALRGWPAHFGRQPQEVDG
ncbi:MAG: formate dehydrogenase [Actinomycetales bacterium]|nr:formate dehydrogenase [Actinomycetales bacterium]